MVSVWVTEPGYFNFVQKEGSLNLGYFGFELEKKAQNSYLFETKIEDILQRGCHFLSEIYYEPPIITLRHL